MMLQKERVRVCILFGGRSGEHEVSLMSARSVLDAIDSTKYDVVQVGITHDGVWLTGENTHHSFISGDLPGLKEVTILPKPGQKGIFLIEEGRLTKFADIDVVFPVLHGSFGEDGTLQGLLEMAGLSYVGSGVAGSSVGMEKGIFKKVMQASDIPVVDGIIINRSKIETDPEGALNAIDTEFNSAYPLFVKPANMGSSVGVTKCQNRSDLIEGLMEAAIYDRRILVETGINAREIEISVMGNDSPIASIAGEIRPEAEFYSYEAKYHDDRSELLIPADISDELMEEMMATAVKAYSAIDCAGLARVDFLLDKDHGKFYINELNTIPGFTKISMYPKLWEASGISYQDLISRLIEYALQRKKDNDRTVRKYDREQKS